MNENRIQNIKNLLQKVSAIRKKYDEIAQITGENYNVFNILNLSTKEVRTHSAFIADLLNINGLHGQGKVFLELFFEQIKRKLNTDKKNKMPTNEANVYVEENIGIISGDEGGRIDIVIKDSNKQIVIENKIYAKDQEKQLVRYNNKYPNAILLYLTLEEQKVSNDSIEKEDGTKLKLNKDYFNITYSHDIKVWLEKCKEKSVNHPILRETLTQYINLIKQLTGQTMSDNMENEITDLLANKENFIAGNEIAKNIEYTKNKLIENFKNDLFKEIKEIGTIVKDKKTENIYEDKQNIFGLYFKINNKFKFYIWAYKNHPVHFGIEEIDNKQIYKNIEINKNDFYVLNNYKKDKEIQINAYKKEEIYLDGFENEITLDLFDKEKREKIVKEICENIKSFADFLETI